MFKKDLKPVVSFKVGENVAALGSDAIVANFITVLLLRVVTNTFHEHFQLKNRRKLSSLLNNGMLSKTSVLCFCHLVSWYPHIKHTITLVSDKRSHLKLSSKLMQRAYSRMRAQR